MNTENTTANANPPKKPSSVTVDALIAKAKLKGQKLAEKNPEAALKLNEASEKSAAAELARKEARLARDQARALRQTQRTADQKTRDTKRAERKAATEAKRAEREAAKADKQSAKGKRTQVLSETAQAALDTLKTMSLVDLLALNAAVNRVCKDRSVAEAGAIADKPEPGDTVEVIAGDHAGKTGVVTKAQRVRCFVKLDGVVTSNGAPKEAYLYITQVRVTTPAQPAA